MTPTTPIYPDLAGQVAVVTGGSGGIGSATCRLLATNGVRVVVTGRDVAAIDAVVRDVRSQGGTAIGIAADVTDFAAIERLREQGEAALGPADILVAIAGGLGDPVPTEQVSEEAWRATVDANLTATFLTTRSFLPGMLERGHGAIVTTASGAGRLPSRSNAAYAAAKAGVVMYTRHLAREMGPRGVRVNCVSPGAVLVPRSPLHRVPEEVRRQVAAGLPLGRLGEPEDIARAILFLASGSSSWITGVTLDVTGGGIMV
jgi:3-oxoacyl-[acyl-carrier protein] reductase